jgi:hypothetical protein
MADETRWAEMQLEEIGRHPRHYAVTREALVARIEVLLRVVHGRDVNLFLVLFTEGRGARVNKAEMRAEVTEAYAKIVFAAVERALLRSGTSG